MADNTAKNGQEDNDKKEETLAKPYTHTHTQTNTVCKCIHQTSTHKTKWISIGLKILEHHKNWSTPEIVVECYWLVVLVVVV